MPRRTCSISPPEWRQPEAGQSITLRLRTITPLFGGGYAPREVDPLCVIRPAAIRGHLRFWWRATAGAQYTTPQALFEAEEALWGSAASDKEPTSGPGKVSVEVTVTKEGRPKRLSEIDPGSDTRRGPRQGVFVYPFQEQRGANPEPEAVGRVDVEFTVRLVWRGEAREALERTLRAWVALGGVGARTRRGCGALAPIGAPAWLDQPRTAADVPNFAQSLVALPDRPNDPEHSVLAGGTLVVGSEQRTAVEAWERLGTFWCALRKGHVGGGPYTPKNGGWEDYHVALADFARQPTPSIALAKPYLGLPIVYQKFEGSPKPARYAPTIESEESGRMASPVILKPLALSSGRFVPIVIVLRAPEPKRVQIKHQGRTAPAKLRNPQQDRVLQRLGVTHPLQAVVKAAEDFFQTQGVRIGGAP